MIRMPFVLMILIGMAGQAVWSEDGKTAPSKYPAFDKYKILVERNAFDATRTSRAKREAQDNAAVPPPPPQALRLLGTWIDGENASALFEGDGANPREGVKRGDNLVGYTIEEIRADAVVLRKDQETLEIRVGSGIEKGSDEKWKVVETVSIKQPDSGPPVVGGWAPKLSSDTNSPDNAAAKSNKESSGTTRKRSKRKEMNP